MVELDSGAVSSRRGRAAGSRANGKGGSSLATSRLFPLRESCIPTPARAAPSRPATLIGPRRVARAPSSFVKNSRSRARITIRDEKKNIRVVLVARIFGIRNALAYSATRARISGGSRRKRGSRRDRARRRDTNNDEIAANRATNMMGID